MLGSTLALTDSSGTIQTEYGYDPFGNATVTGASSGNLYQFTGRENDETGLYFYRARYYSPTLQRFTSQDPIAFARGGSNLYGYVLNNPVSLADLLGLITPTPTPTRTPTPTPIPAPTPGPTTFSCFLGSLGRDPGPGLRCLVGTGVCIYAPGYGSCGLAVIGCIQCANNLASCYNNPNRLLRARNDTLRA